MPELLQKRIRSVRFLFLHRCSLATIKKWQSIWLRNIVQYAEIHVPAYAHLYAAAGIDPSKIHSVGDISRLPIVTKDFFRNTPAEQLLDTSRTFTPQWLHTSGTTGKPLTIAASAVRTMPEYVGFSMYRFLLGRWMFLGRFTKTKLVRIDMRAPTRTNQLLIAIPDFLAHPTESIEKINAYKPHVIVSFVSILLELARTVAQNPKLLTNTPRYVVSTGEGLSPFARNVITNALECEIYERYGNAEIGAIALECAQHDGMHINVESVIVEVVDGRIIVTDLLNYNMPCIRYDTGDHGLLVTTPCACGLETPRLWVQGRYTGFLTFGTQRVHEFEFDFFEKEMHTVAQYQLVKVDERQMLARVVPTAAFDASTVVEIEEKIHNIVGEGVMVHIETVQTIPLTSGGKSKIVVDESNMHAV